MATKMVPTKRRRKQFASVLSTSGAHMFAVIIFVHTISTGAIDQIKVTQKYPSYEACEAARPDAENGYKRFLEIRLAPKFIISSKCVAERSRGEGA